MPGGRPSVGARRPSAAGSAAMLGAATNASAIAALLPPRPLNARSATATISPGNAAHPAKRATPTRSSRPPTNATKTPIAVPSTIATNIAATTRSNEARHRQHPHEHVATKGIGAQRMRSQQARANARRATGQRQAELRAAERRGHEARQSQTVASRPPQRGAVDGPPIRSSSIPPAPRASPTNVTPAGTWQAPRSTNTTPAAWAGSGERCGADRGGAFRAPEGRTRPRSRACRRTTASRSRRFAALRHTTPRVRCRASCRRKSEAPTRETIAECGPTVGIPPPKHHAIAATPNSGRAHSAPGPRPVPRSRVVVGCDRGPPDATALAVASQGKQHRLPPR